MMSLLHFDRHWFAKNITFILISAVLCSIVLTYITITNNASPLAIKPQRTWSLLVINIGLLITVIGIIAARIFGLWRALRTGSTNSSLQKRILVLFSIVAIVPTIIVSIFAALFFNLGIQTWFNSRIETAVNESLAVAEAYLAEHKENIRADALAMATDLNQFAELAISDPQEFNRMVATQSALRLLSDAIVIQNNRIIALGRLSFALAFERIPENVLERAKAGEVVITTTDDDKVRALVRLEGLQNAYLLVGRVIDSKVVDRMRNTEGAANEYNELRTQLDRLQMIFSVVFITLAALLLLSSIGYGMVFAARLTRPIADLAAATERVRGGDFNARVEDTGQKDDIGMLTRAFNRMTEQLYTQRGQLIEANRRLDERRRFSEAVLSGVSAGVIAIDRDKKITLFNRSSAAILSSIDQMITPGAHISDILPGIQELLVQAEHVPTDVPDSTLTLNKNDRSITLHLRISVEKSGEGIEGFIVTFDDITLLISAQRNAAWADVARRIAHEIKNPLTPIQLSAERLKRKYLKFITEDQENYIKYIDTIAKHVADIGRMVEEFVSFARMPTPVFTNEDFAAIIKKSVFSAQVTNPAIEYELVLPDALVTLHCDERQISQIMTNLLKNAAEAVEARLLERPTEITKGLVKVMLSCKEDKIILLIEDNGIGFPPGQIQKMFEPYVTTRSKGTGLGLSIVKKIVEEHKGLINIENISGGGARVTLSFLQHCDINAAS